MTNGSDRTDSDQAGGPTFQLARGVDLWPYQQSWMPKGDAVITHRADDEGVAYWHWLKREAGRMSVQLQLIDHLIGEERATVDGHKLYALEDAYPHADLVTYPSNIEGFGNAFLEVQAIFDAPVPGDGSILTAMGRWHFGFHAEADLPEAMVAGREEIYLRYMYRKAGARPDAVSEEAQREYLRTYTQPGAMRAGFNYYREMARDAKDNQAFIKQGKLQMPILVYGGGAANAGRGLYAMDSWQRVADNVCGGVAEGCGHWIPEERPAWTVERLLEFFGEVERRRAGPDRGNQDMQIDCSSAARRALLAVALLLGLAGRAAPVSGNRVDMTLYEVDDVGFLQNDDPNDDPVVPVGTLAMEFSSCNAGEVTFDTSLPDVGSGSFAVERITDLLNTQCSGGISDDTPAGVVTTEQRLALVSARQGITGSGHADFEERAMDFFHGFGIRDDEVVVTSVVLFAAKMLGGEMLVL